MLLNAEEGKGHIRAFHRQNWSEARWVEKRGQRVSVLCAEEVMADISLGDLPSGRFMWPLSRSHCLPQ